MYSTSIVAFVSHRLYGSGDLAENLASRDELAKELVRMNIVPLLPHFPYMNEETDRAKIMVCCKRMIDICDVVVYDHTKLSLGCLEEIKHAQQNLVPCFDIKLLRHNYRG